MGLSFHKSYKHRGGTRVNISECGIDASVGVKGFHSGVNARRRSYTRFSVPGTGMYERKNA
jgi:hypothetical protein